VVEKPMPTFEHGEIALEIGAALKAVGYASVEARAIIPASAAVDATAPLPDVSFYRSGRPERGQWMTAPPHVAVEILSPGQSRRDLRAKIDAYIAFGVESIWVVDPFTETVDVHENGERRTLEVGHTLESPAAPGFRMPVRQLFSR
jgi:Uma2 family endonuclease